MPTSTTIDGIEIERTIQATFRLKHGGLVVYLDPHRVAAGAEKADLILITHEHFDHLDTEAIAALRTADTIIVVNERCANKLARTPGIVTIREGQSLSEKGVPIRAVAGYNGYHPRGFNVGFVFQVGGKTFYHAGDTGRVPEMAQLRGVDVALLPIGGTYTMDEAEAAEAVKDIRPRTVIPMHYGYATGGDAERFKSLVGDVAQVIILEG